MENSEKEGLNKKYLTIGLLLGIIGAFLIIYGIMNDPDYPKMTTAFGMCVISGAIVFSCMSIPKWIE